MCLKKTILQNSMRKTVCTTPTVNGTYCKWLCFLSTVCDTLICLNVWILQSKHRSTVGNFIGLFEADFLANGSFLLNVKKVFRYGPHFLSVPDAFFVTQYQLWIS